MLTYLIYGWPLKYQKDEGKSSRNTDTNIKLGLIFRSISARLVTCTSTCPIIQYGLFGGITFEKIISDWIHVIWLFVFTMRWNIFWKLYICTVYSSKNKKMSLYMINSGCLFSQWGEIFSENCIFAQSILPKTKTVAEGQ